jgi:hypothetical protein
VHSVVCTPISSLRKARTCFAPPPGPLGNRRRSSATPARPSGTVPHGLGTARFPSPVELKKRRSARCPRVAALVQIRPPKPPPRPAGGSHCLGYHLGRAGGWQGPPEGRQLRVLGSPSALRTKGPRTGGPPGGRGVRGPGFFLRKPIDTYTCLRALKPACGPWAPRANR